MKTWTKMYNSVHLWVLPLIIISLTLPQSTLSCPHPCACYVKSEVHCTFRSLAAVPGRIPKHVERINLGFNTIQSIGGNSFAGLSKLEMLLIHSNNIHNIPNGAFKDLVSLQVFKMSYNQLKVITSHTFHGLTGLARLHVDHNKIESIHPNAFNGLASLRLLHLEGNLIKQLHPNTFCTFIFLDYFRQSTLRHLYLSENSIQTLPAAMMKTMPLLESLYLHGNPWACDCRLKWFMEWEKQFNGVLKCKKDRAYENGQLCALCAAPKELHNQELQSLKDLPCTSPIIYLSHKANSSDPSTDENDQDLQLLPSYETIVGKIILNMTDEHGNKVNLDCEMKKSDNINKIQWSQLHAEEIDINATFTLDFECPMNRENYEKLWKLIAYYSEVPVKLEKELIFSNDPKVTYRYKQNMEHDSYYYTGVRALVIAEPSWVLQTFINLQLNRKKSTAKKVTLTFTTHYSQSIHTKDIQYPKNNWVMIEKSDKTKTSFSVVKGAGCQLICNVKSSETPSIEWRLPDGTKLKAPYSSQDNRVSISANGHLVIKRADLTDSGEYQCIAQVNHDMDVLSYRVEVLPLASETSERNINSISKSVGEPVTLNCIVIANPDADVHWILPNNNIIDISANKTSIYLLNNGSLVVPNSRLTDSGLYRCIAVNQYGADYYSLHVEINKKVSEQSMSLSKMNKRPVIVISTKPKHNVIDDDGGSGEKNAHEESEKFSVQDKAKLSKNRMSSVSRGNGQQNRKDRRKIKTLKNVDSIEGSNIAEGRRKFESRRRVNVGNKQIDPKQWANILAKVRGKNVQRTTDAPLFITTKPMTTPSFRRKATTPSSIARPPLNPIVESEIILEEASADGSNVNEDELLFITSSPLFTLTHTHEETSLDNLGLLSSATEENYDDTLAENNKEGFTTEGISKPEISILEHFETDVPVYSPKGGGIKTSFIEVEDKVTDSSIMTNIAQVTEADHTSALISTVKNRENNLVEQSNKIEIFPTDHNEETVVDLNEMESYSAEMLIVSEEESTTLNTTISPLQYNLKMSATTENIDSQNNNINTFIKYAKESDYQYNIHRNNPISNKEDMLLSTTSKEFGTPTTTTHYEQNIHKVMVSLIPNLNYIPTATTPDADLLMTTRAPSFPLITNPLSKGSSEIKNSKDYIEKTENMNTDMDKNNFVSFSIGNVYVGYETNIAGKSTDRTHISKPEFVTTTIPSHTVSSKKEQGHLTTSVFPGALHTIVSENNQIKSTTPPSLTNGNFHYPRRRPNGRRRFRPNRLRHRPNQFVPTVPTTTQTHQKTVIENPFVSLSGKETNIKMSLLPTKSNDVILVPTMKDRLSNDIVTTTINPIFQRTTKSSQFNYFSSTASTQKVEISPYRTTSKTWKLPPTSQTTTTTTKTLNEYSTGKSDSAKELYTLPNVIDKNVMTLNNLQTTTSQYKTTYDSGEIGVGTRVYNNVLSTMHTTMHPLSTEESTTNDQHTTIESNTEIPPETKTGPKLVLERILPLTTMSTTESYDIDPAKIPSHLLIDGSTAMTATTSAPTYITRETSTTSYRKGSFLPNKTENKHLDNTSLENRHKNAFVFKGMKELTTQPVEYSVIPETAKMFKLLPVTKRFFVPTAHFYPTTTSTQSFLFQTTVKLLKEHEAINQVEPTQASKLETANVQSSKQNEMDKDSLNQNKMFIKPNLDQFKETYILKPNNSLLYNTRFHHHPRIPQNNQHRVQVPPYYNPARVTARPSYYGTHGPLRYFVTNQAIAMTNKPEITAYTVQNFQDKKTNLQQIPTTTQTTTTTTVIPLFRPKPLTPSRFNYQGQRISPNARPFGNNVNTDSKDIQSRNTYQGNPYYLHPRIQYRFNRTKNFRNTVTSKPQLPIPFIPVDHKNNSKYSFVRVTTPTYLIRTTNPPVPIATSSRAPLTTSKMIFTNHFISTSPYMQTRIPQPSSTIQPNWHTNYYIHRPPVVPNTQDTKVRNTNVVQHSLNIRHHEKPKITTIGFQSLSVPFDMNAVLPCETTGHPKPTITWTKVATGAIMSTNTKMQRFEVLENGTLLIQNLQLQDRGQYVCTAQNQHGSDKMLITLTVIAQQPKILVSRYKDVTVYLGDTTAMDCNASGVPSPHISWILPDRKIMRTISTAPSRIMLFENGTLSVKETTFSDRGIFKCVASNVAGADSLTVRLHIAALPPIIQQEKLENISLPQSHSIYIHCSAKGAPLPSIRWVLIDGTQVRPSQYANGNLFIFPNGTLYIRNISQRDIGKYECIAANIVGTARRTVILDVKKYTLNAKITASSPQKTDVTYGSTLRLDCSAAGDPWPRILWRLPSKRLVDSFFSFDSRIKTFANGTLIIYSVTEKDAGDYLCMARNKLGDDYVVLKVNVMMKPAKIQYKNEVDHKVMYGGDLKVDCVATGVPNPEISWSLPDGSMINNVMQSDDSGARTKRYVVFNNGTLYFNEVGMKEEGDYTCYAVNQIGQDEMRVSVKVVAEGAVIKNKTYSTVNVPYGDVITIPCEAKGEPVPKITWLSPANRPIPVLSDKYQVYRDGTLFLQKAQRSDSGNYTCLAQNNAGEDKKIVQIQVNILPPKINGYSSKITTIKEAGLKDSRMLIDCKADGIPTPRVMWAFPEGVILPAPYYGNRITVHRNGTLDIKVLRKSDSVQLVCIGRNEGGEAKLIVQLTVNEPAEKPKFNKNNENIVVAEGQVIHLNCSAVGIPEPERTWILPNGSELQSGNHLHRFYHKQDGTLYIGSTVVADAGTYRCRAANIAGYADKLVNLQIGRKPQMNTHYNNLVSIINGETLQLHCSTHGSPQPHISWTLPNGMVLDGTQSKGRFTLLQNGSLVVRDTTVYDRGTYLCKATTQYGSSTMNVPVIVIAYPPRITTGPAPVIYARLGSSIQLNCMSIGIPKAEITWELPDKSHLTAGAQSRLYGNKFLHPQGTLVIQHPSQRDVGYYKCTAKNILGSDTKTTYLHIY